MKELKEEHFNDSNDVAIVGMSCRFPGAPSIDDFWRNLRDGIESIRFFSDEEMKQFGVDSAELLATDFVKAGARIEDSECFDAAFFGFSPREARSLDPQHRVFLECAYQAFDDAGCDTETFPGLVGVYAGTSMSSYLLFNLLSDAVPEDSFEMMIGNDKDFLSTRVSYLMNLKGPSIDVQTACSTSLVAVHLACQGLLTYQCDIALAGGVSIQPPQRTGYYYQPGGINSPDGHCRAFDAKAQGTIFGNGAGAVVLKRLADAESEGDSIYAVIKGSAVNNDGRGKVGYTAPGLEGQAQVIVMAQSVAGIEPETIGYVEAHGTGTPLGDPVEVEALTRAFRSRTGRTGFCGLGSVKTNIGHLDAASGVAGLIKAVLALKNKELPPSLHFETINPKINLDESPFFINSRLAEWKRGSMPRRAGVSSFGIGGTNAHVIVEEPVGEVGETESRPWQVLLMSAKTGTALDRATLGIREYLDQHRDACLADVAHTLQVGRRTYSHRRFAVCRNVEDALEVLGSLDAERVASAYCEERHVHTAFLFPGGGAQYVNMGRDLYLRESVFRRHIDECAALLRNPLGYDLLYHLYPAEDKVEQAASDIRKTSPGLAALFTVEYALAKLLMSWGVQPHAMIGHSLGEYVAACLAGVFTLSDALRLVVERGRLFDKMPKGGMLSLSVSEAELETLIDSGLSVAARNAPRNVVVSGDIGAIEDLAEKLGKRDVDFRRIQIEVAAHSHLVAPISEEFRRFVARHKMSVPQIPFVSNVTGTWITDEQAVDPAYWSSQLRKTVQFSDGVRELMTDPDRIFLEVGPGQGLSMLTKQQGDPARVILPSMRHPYDRREDSEVLIAAVGRLFLAGASIDWRGFYSSEKRRRIHLPSYPFERERHWVEPCRGSRNSKAPGNGGLKTSRIEEWLYVPSWKRTPAVRSARPNDSRPEPRTWMVMHDGSALADRILALLTREGQDFVSVKQGNEPAGESIYFIDPTRREAYGQLFSGLRSIGKMPDVIVHMWSITGDETERPGADYFRRMQEKTFDALLSLAQSLIEIQDAKKIELCVISDAVLSIESSDISAPEKSTILAPCKVIPQEVANLSCRFIDIGSGRRESLNNERLAETLLCELRSGSQDAIVGYRGGHRWTQIYEPVRLDKGTQAKVSRSEVVVVIGGLGGVGFHLAAHLARTQEARLVLIQRTVLPERKMWDDWLLTHEEADPISGCIRKVRSLEQTGCDLIVVSADLVNEEQMRSVFSLAIERWGRVDRIIHAAGLAGERGVKLISDETTEGAHVHFAAKAYGLYILERLVREYKIPSCILISSNASVLGGLGSFSYSAASIFMDSFVEHANKLEGSSWISANWDGWLFDDEQKLKRSVQTSIDRFAMLPAESLAAFDLVSADMPPGQVVVSTGSLEDRLRLWIRPPEPGDVKPGDGEGATRPSRSRSGLTAAFIPAKGELEEGIANIWQDLLGVEAVGAQDNFFDLGGNSLIGLRVISRLKKDLGVEVPVVALFEGPTVGALAKLITRSSGGGDAVDQPGPGNRDRGERRRERLARVRA